MFASCNSCIGPAQTRCVSFVWSSGSIATVLGTSEPEQCSYITQLIPTPSSPSGRQARAPKWNQTDSYRRGRFSRPYRWTSPARPATPAGDFTGRTIGLWPSHRIRVFNRLPFETKLINKTKPGQPFRHVNDDVLHFNTQCSAQWDGFQHFGYQKAQRYYGDRTHRDIVDHKHHWHRLLAFRDVQLI